MKKSRICSLSPWLQEYVIPITLLGLAGIFWLSKCGSSLMIDETLTCWIVKERFTDVVYRSFYLHSPGLFYFLVVWLFVQIGGGSEIVLRIPSILSCIFLCAVLFRFSCKIFDRTSAFLGVLVLLCLDGTFTWAVNARPYALALLLSVSSTYSLYLWTESSERRYKFFYILFSTLTVYTHFVFSGIFVVHLLYLYCRRRWVKDQVFPKFYEIIMVYLCTAVLLFPAAYQAVLTVGRKSILSPSPMPTILTLIQAWVKPYLVLSLICGVLAATIIVKKVHIDRFAVRPDLLVLLLTWYLIPALGAFLFSVSIASIFLPRYYLYTLPALSLLLGKLLSLIKPIRSRCIIVAIFIGLLLIYGGVKSPFIEDWSSAIEFVRTKTSSSEVPVVVSTGLAESQDTNWLVHPEKRSYLLSPFAVYRLGKTPLLLPALFGQPGAAEYLEKKVFPVLRNVNQFYLILRMTYVVINKSLSTSDTYLANKMEQLGFQINLVETFGNVKVIIFERI